MNSLSFSNYLLSHNAVSSEQLVKALSASAELNVSPAVLSIYFGKLTAHEAESINALIAENGASFEETVVQKELLTSDEVSHFMNDPHPDYLLLVQALFEQNLMDLQQFENYFIAYQSDTEIYVLDITDDVKTKVQQLLKEVTATFSEKQTLYCEAYFDLLFNNFIHYIGDDFTILSPIECPEYPSNYLVAQKLTGDITIQSALDMNNNVAVEFASRFSKEDFHEFNEYAHAALDDFLNLHNGVYNVNISNIYSSELTLFPPTHYEFSNYVPVGKTYFIPIIYSFGSVNFIFTI